MHMHMMIKVNAITLPGIRNLINGNFQYVCLLTGTRIMVHFSRPDEYVDNLKLNIC
jgi:hypothetical protein